MTTDITMHLTVNTKALRATLARMKKLGGKSPTVLTAHIAVFLTQRDLLAEWVDAHLQAEARGEGTFEIGTKTVVMNEAGQVSLFGGRDE